MLRIEQREHSEHFDTHNLTIDFVDGSHFEFSYYVPQSIPNQYTFPNKDGIFTTDPGKFIDAHHTKTKACYGIINYDYCDDAVIRAKDGKIGVYLQEYTDKPSLTLSAELAEQLIAEFKKI